MAEPMLTQQATWTRRSFLKTAATTAAGITLVPRHAVARSGQTPPSEKPNLAGIGVGGMGAGDLDALAPHCNVVALCDVDQDHAAGTFKRFPNAARYVDYRKMFDAMAKNIDAVLVATPDHFHAVATMAAIEHGKHVYCEKPLAHSIQEVRAVMRAAARHKVVTQLGNQGHSFDTMRDFREWVQAGAIGNVHTIHAGASAVNSGLDDLPHLGEPHPVPATLDWDQWLGPAQQRAYNPAYLPARWRGWVPFGNGTVGDWVCHVVDPVNWTLDLGAPASVQADVKDYDFKTQGDAFPKAEVITYEFAAKGNRGPVTLKWYSGTEHIPRPPEMDADDKPIEYGAVVMGDKGTIVYGSHGAGQVRLIPQAKMDAYQKPPKTLPRAKEHHLDWVQAIRNGSRAGSDFSYGGPLTEIALLGVIAIKMAGRKLEWDPVRMRFPNCPEADCYLNPPYRTGWKLG